MPTCIFCDRERLELLMESRSAFAVRDKFPVRPLHTLVLPKRHVGDTFDLTREELQDLFDLARRVRDALMAEDPLVKGYNFGTNNGAAAGQKIPHVHFHLIPRRDGELPPPTAHPDSGSVAERKS